MNTFDQLETMRREREKPHKKTTERLKTKPKMADNFVMARAGQALEAPTWISLEDLPLDWRVEFEERAAILEYDGGLNREKADAQAFTEILQRIRDGRLSW